MNILICIHMNSLMWMNCVTYRGPPRRTWYKSFEGDHLRDYQYVFICDDPYVFIWDYSYDIYIYIYIYINICERRVFTWVWVRVGDTIHSYQSIHMFAYEICIHMQRSISSHMYSCVFYMRQSICIHMRLFVWELSETCIHVSVGECRRHNSFIWVYSYVCIWDYSNEFICIYIRRSICIHMRLFVWELSVTCIHVSVGACRWHDPFICVYSYICIWDYSNEFIWDYSYKTYQKRVFLRVWMSVGDTILSYVWYEFLYVDLTFRTLIWLFCMLIWIFVCWWYFAYIWYDSYIWHDSFESDTHSRGCGKRDAFIRVACLCRTLTWLMHLTRLIQIWHLFAWVWVT